MTYTDNFALVKLKCEAQRRMHYTNSPLDSASYRWFFVEDLPKRELTYILGVVKGV